MSNSGRYLVKICGNVYPDTSRMVASCRPDFMGWIFAPSPRRISVQSAATQIRMVRMTNPYIMHVIVAAGYAPDKIIQALRRMSSRNAYPDAVQVVGSSAYIARLEFLLRQESDIPVIPVIRPKSELDDSHFLAVRSGHHPFFIVDAHDDGMYGGTGKVVNTDFFSEDISKPYLLAGGLTPENVRERLNYTNATGADVSSGVETKGKPGEKDPEKVLKFINEIRK